MRRGLVVVLALLASFGCAPRPSRLYVVIDSDLDLMTEIDRVEISVRSDRGVAPTVAVDLFAALLPTSVLVERLDGTGSPVSIRATAFNDGVPIIRQTVETVLVPGDVRAVDVFFSSRCVLFECAEPASCRPCNTCALDRFCGRISVPEPELRRIAGPGSELDHDASLPGFTDAPDASIVPGVPQLVRPVSGARGLQDALEVLALPVPGVAASLVEYAFTSRCEGGVPCVGAALPDWSMSVVYETTIMAEGLRLSAAGRLPVSEVAPVGARYHWRARACESGVCSAWSESRYLDVDRVPSDVDGDGTSDVALVAEVAGASRLVLVRGSDRTVLTTIAIEDLPVDPGSTFELPALVDADGDGFADVHVFVCGDGDCSGTAPSLWTWAGGATLGTRIFTSLGRFDASASVLVDGGDLNGAGGRFLALRTLGRLVLFHSPPIGDRVETVYSFEAPGDGGVAGDCAALGDRYGEVAVATPAGVSFFDPAGAVGTWSLGATSAVTCDYGRPGLSEMVVARTGVGLAFGGRFRDGLPLDTRAELPLDPTLDTYATLRGLREDGAVILTGGEGAAVIRATEMDVTLLLAGDRLPAGPRAVSSILVSRATGETTLAFGFPDEPGGGAVVILDPASSATDPIDLSALMLSRPGRALAWAAPWRRPDFEPAPAFVPAFLRAG